MRRIATLLILVMMLASCGDTSFESVVKTSAGTITVSSSDASGAAIWQGRCASCHGAAGEGNKALGAPALTQLSADYIERQLNHFATGVRGAQGSDEAGKRMALSVANLNDREIPDLVELITTELQPTQPAATVSGDAERGKDYYTNICSACHATNAQGNDVLGAPALAGANDWYLKSSYEGYLEGIRGAHPDDFYGAQMARLAPALSNGDDINDVIAFIATLPPQR